jgi:hypothetical protein
MDEEELDEMENFSGMFRAGGLRGAWFLGEWSLERGIMWARKGFLEATTSFDYPLPGLLFKTLGKIASLDHVVSLNYKSLLIVSKLI